MKLALRERLRTWLGVPDERPTATEFRAAMAEKPQETTDIRGGEIELKRRAYLYVRIPNNNGCFELPLEAGTKLELRAENARQTNEYAVSNPADFKAADTLETQ